MKRQYLTNQLKALNELRRLVYFLAENVELSSMWSARANACIEHLELRGESRKQIIVNMLIDSQRHSTLCDFIRGLIDIGIIGDDFINIDCLQLINFELPDLENVSFEVPRDSCCYFENLDDKSICHTPVIITKPHKKYNCQYTKYCSICGKKIETETSHEWGEWFYVREDKCNQKRKCSKCNEEETRIRHDWTNWTSNKNGSRFRRCLHCHIEEYEIDGIWKGFILWNNGTKDFWEVSIKTSGFLFETTKAEIKVYVNVSDNNHCEYIVQQRASVKVEGHTITLKGKKIVSTTDKRKKYNLDCFIGKIGSQCSFLEGKVDDGVNIGVLKLSF